MSKQQTLVLRFYICSCLGIWVALSITGCQTTFDKDDITSYDDAMERTIQNNEHYERGYQEGQDRAIIDLKNERGEVWKRYLNTHRP
jgi:hypothetical protein